jgi:hypothetical protein
MSLQEYSRQIQTNVALIQQSTESPTLQSLLNQLDSLAYLIDEEINQINPDTDSSYVEEPGFVEFSEEEIEEETEWSSEDIPDSENESDMDVSKFIPFKKKSDAGLRIQFGINSLYNPGTRTSGFLYPEINTGGSWYGDFGIVKKIRIGGESSKVAFLFGASWLVNQYSFQNDVVFKESTVSGPEFIKLESVSKHPRLHVGYVTIPLSFRFSLSRKLKLEAGGYAGYRLLSVEKTERKAGEDVFHTQRYSDFYLNNWLVGASASVHLSGLNLTCRYSFSDLFKENPNYNFNTFMIGTSFVLF